MHRNTARITAGGQPVSWAGRTRRRAPAGDRRRPRVACDALVRLDGTVFAVLARHAAEPLTVAPVLTGGGGLTTVDGEPAGPAITLDPFGIKIFSVTGSGP
jgi:hypothetical protein